MIRMQPVSSSNLKAAGYDPKARELHIQFPNGLYIHDDVPQEEFDNLMAAESPGGHYHRNIKGKFAHRRG